MLKEEDGGATKTMTLTDKTVDCVQALTFDLV